MKTALDAFLVDPLPPDAAACYPVERMVWFLDDKGEIMLVSKPRRQAHFPLIELEPALLLLRAVEMQLLAAGRNPVVPEAEVALWFDRADMVFDSMWTRGDATVARTEANLMGIRPQKGDLTNLVLYNPKGVIRVSPTPRFNMMVS